MPYRNRRSRRGFNSSLDYIQGESEQNAIAKMELAFKKEKFEASEEQREITNKRTAQKFDSFETTQRIQNIGIKASPLVSALTNPLDLTEEDLKSLKTEIDSFANDSNLTYNDLDKAAYDSTITSLNKMYENAVITNESTNEFNKIRNSLNNLYGDEDSAGKFSSKNIGEIVTNIEGAIQSYGKKGSESIVKGLEAQRANATKINFIAGELERYDVSPPLNPQLQETVDKARRAAKREDYGLAYELLASQNNSDAGFKSDGMKDAQAIQDDEVRRVLNSNKKVGEGILASIEVKNAPAAATYLKALDTTKANYINDPKGFQTQQNYFRAVVQEVSSREDGMGILNFDGIGSVFSKTGLVDADRNPNDLETAALLMSGYITHLGNGEFRWADGEMYKISDGANGTKFIEGNRYGEKDFDPNRWLNQIDANLRELNYDVGNKSEARTLYKSIAESYLQTSPSIANRKSIKDKKTAKFILNDEKNNTPEIIIEKVKEGQIPPSELSGLQGRAPVYNAIKLLSEKKPNSKIIVESPDGRQETIRAKEFQTLFSLFESNRAQLDGMKIVTVVSAGNNLKNAKAPSSNKGFRANTQDKNNLARAKKTVSRAKKALSNAKKQKSIDFYNNQLKEAQDIIDDLEQKN